MLSRIPLRAALGVAAAVLALAGSARAAATADVDSYRGLGAWVDIYDLRLWAKPEATVAAIASRGVRTLYLETGNYKQKAALVRPVRLGRFLDAAHAAGLRVVAWYLPAFANVARDLRRSLAAIDFRTPAGEAFDSFALDIEASVVRSPAVRTRRALDLSQQLRAAAGRSFPLGAIIPSPRGMELSPTYWPGFPYAGLAETYDVILPMSYFTYRVEGGPAVRRYIERSIEIIREATGNPRVPIHVIGGLGEDTSRAEARGFMRAVAGCAPLGYSIYDYSTTAEATWAALTAPPPAPASPGCQPPA